MRRLLPAIAALGLLLALAGPAFATNRLPGGVTKINITVTFPLRTVSGYRKTLHRTLTKASAVSEVVKATNALPVASIRGVCPMVMRLGPVLTVVFRNSSGTEVADAVVDVTQGSRGTSGSSPCFPIRFESDGKGAALLGNNWVRMVGKLSGTSIS